MCREKLKSFTREERAVLMRTSFFCCGELDDIINVLMGRNLTELNDGCFPLEENCIEDL